MGFRASKDLLFSVSMSLWCRGISYTMLILNEPHLVMTMILLSIYIHIYMYIYLFIYLYFMFDLLFLGGPS